MMAEYCEANLRARAVMVDLEEDLMTMPISFNRVIASLVPVRAS